VPAIRTKLIRRLTDQADLLGKTEPVRTADLAAAVDMVTKTAHRHLEDLALLGLAARSKAGATDNAPDMWGATDWLRQFWPDPQSETEMYVRTGSGLVRGPDEGTEDTPTDTPLRTSLSHLPSPDGIRPCGMCGEPFHPAPRSRAVCDTCRVQLAGAGR
jgi:hypothetical protein